MGKEQQYLIDSNALIDFLAGKLPEEGKLFMNRVVNDIPRISVISKIEILGFESTPEIRNLLKDFVDDSIVPGLTEEVVKYTIELRKNIKIKTPDAIIASTALANDLTLITRNVKDFDKIQNLKLLNPHQI